MEEIEKGFNHQKNEVEGEYKKVFEDIKYFANERKEGREPVDGPLLMVLSGTQRGIYGASGCVALEQLGLRNGFKTAVGVSAGSPAISYLLAGQIEIGITIHYEENVGKEFIDLRRGGQDGKSAVDITWLVNNVFRNGPKKLNIEEFEKNKTQVFYAATDALTGEGELLDGKHLVDPVEGIRASVAIPEMYKEKVIINVDGVERQFVDGAVAYPFPVIETLELVHPTSVLVFANRPKITEESFFSKLINKYQSMVVATSLEKNILLGRKIFERELYELRNSGIPYIIIWTDDKVGAYERNPEKLKEVGGNFKNYVLSLYNS